MAITKFPGLIPSCLSLFMHTGQLWQRRVGTGRSRRGVVAGRDGCRLGRGGGRGGPLAGAGGWGRRRVQGRFGRWREQGRNSGAEQAARGGAEASVSSSRQPPVRRLPGLCCGLPTKLGVGQPGHLHLHEVCGRAPRPGRACVKGEAL